MRVTCCTISFFDFLPRLARLRSGRHITPISRSLNPKLAQMTKSIFLHLEGHEKEAMMKLEMHGFAERGSGYVSQSVRNILGVVLHVSIDI